MAASRKWKALAGDGRPSKGPNMPMRVYLYGIPICLTMSRDEQRNSSGYRLRALLRLCADGTASRRQGF
jgi:hypothetical protein